MDFSRLNDTRFPNFDTTAPYDLKNTFDYTRWVPETKIHMVNVLWNGDYSNVVKFDDDKKRDAWFDSISDQYVLTLKSNARIVPDGTIKLPLPYDVAARYDYLYVDIPLATSKDAKIQYETDGGVRRWFFFVGDIDYSAPNTTIVHLSLDVWTQFINQSRISYMMLERGHAPVAMSDTDSYLANPIANNRYLLAPDVNFDDTSIVTNSKWVPFCNGRRLVCLASTCGYDAMEAGFLGEARQDSSRSFSDPSFSNTADWYGYQLQVNGYGYGNGWDYSGMRAYADSALAVDSRLPNGSCVYAIRSEQFAMFMQHAKDVCPAFMRTLVGCFVVDEAMVTIQQHVTFIGYDLMVVNGAEHDVTGYKLTRDMFGLTKEQQRFAKLYTYPYSRLEVSDDNGRTVEVRIENTGDIRMRMLTSMAFPTLSCRVFLSGINGVGSQQYSWHRMVGSEATAEIPDGDWDKLTFELGIPCYSIYMNADLAWMMDNAQGLQSSRERALAAYHNSVRSANVAYANAVASAQNNHDNSVREADSAQANARDSAATANANAVGSADTAQTNANAMAATGQTNSDNMAACNRNNINATIAANNANTASANNASERISSESVNTNSANTAATNAASAVTVKEDNQTSISTTKANGETSVSTGALSGIQSGAMAGSGMGVGGLAMAAGGAIIGAYSAYLSASTANDNASIVAQANTVTMTATTNANSTVTSNNNAQSIGSTGYQNTSRTEQNDNNNQCLGTQRDNNYNTAVTNAANLYNTQTANSGRTHATDVGNANRTQNTTDSNADRTHGTAVTNANATNATSQGNATRSREVGILNAQETLRASQDAQRYALSDASRHSPVQVTSASGDAVPLELNQYGIQIRLRTQSQSAMAQTAAQFARYGYALNQLWDVDSTGLNMMRYFTYWKAADVWVDVRNVAGSEEGDRLSRILLNGTTVWRNPDMIGKVSIYDN